MSQNSNPRACGFLDDPADVVSAELQSHHVRALVGEPAVLPGYWDFVAQVQGIPDQGRTSSCVAQAFSTSFETRSHIIGAPIERPSVLAGYTGGRLVAAPKSVLVDGGSNPLAVLEAYRKYGLVAESRFPFSEDRVNAPLPLDVFQHGADATLGGHYRIGAGAGAGLELRRALFAGYIPVFAMSVDQRFFDLEGGRVYMPSGGPKLGRHMQAIVGYAPGKFLIAGSWGRGWAEDGFAWIDERFIESSECSSFIVPTIIPTKVS